MLELLVGSGGGYYPFSGPGPKKLRAGDINYGYFGEVTEDQMGLNDEFKRLLNDTYASIRSVGAVTNIWFKFFVNQKVLFFPKLPLAGRISMTDLYAMRAVFDSDEAYKPTTDYTTGQPLYTQSRYIGNGTDLFKLRLMDWLPSAAGVSNTTGATPTSDSELYMLIMALVNTGRAYTDKLHIRAYLPRDFYVLQDGLSYPESWVKETGVSGSTTSTFTYSIDNEVTYWRTTDQAWRPVLQYVPPTDMASLLLIPENLNISNSGMPHQVVTTGVVTTDLFSLLNFHSEGVSHEVVTSGSVDNPGYILAPYALQTDDNTVPTFSFTLDTSFGLYDTNAVAPSDYNGYVTGSTDNGNSLTYASGAGTADMGGYVTAS